MQAQFSMPIVNYILQLWVLTCLVCVAILHASPGLSGRSDKATTMSTEIELYNEYAVSVADTKSASASIYEAFDVAKYALQALITTQQLHDLASGAKLIVSGKTRRNRWWSVTPTQVIVGRYSFPCYLMPGTPPSIHLGTQQDTDALMASLVEITSIENAMIQRFPELGFEISDALGEIKDAAELKAQSRILESARCV